MTNEAMMDLWKLINDGISDLKDACRERCKTCRYSDLNGLIRGQWPCITCYGNPIYPHLKDYPDHYEKLTNFGE